MSSRALVVLVFGCLVQLLIETSPVHGAVIPQSIDIATTDATLGGVQVYCNKLEGWIGEGIVPSDCAEAISEFRRTNVRPRGKQEFEFLSRGVSRVTHLPYINTPRKYDYGTCVIDIAMLDGFHSGGLPGVKPRSYESSDTATFYDILRVAVELSSTCVNGKGQAQAGWSYAGAKTSIGVFILRRGSDLDKVLGGSTPLIKSSNNGTSFSSLITSRIPSNVRDVVNS